MIKQTEALKLAIGYMEGTLVTDHLTGYERKRHVIKTIRSALEEQPAQREVTRKPLTEWIAVSDRIPLESDGEVLVRMRDGRCEIAWASYWHGASNKFAQWTFRDPDEDEAPTHWMPIPAIEAAHGIKGGA